MDYYDFVGKITEVFAPGYCDSEGRLLTYRDALLIGFRIAIDGPEDGRKLSRHSYPNELIIIEKENQDNALFSSGDTVCISSEIVLMDDNWPGYSGGVFLNLSNTSRIKIVSFA